MEKLYSVDTPSDTRTIGIPAIPAIPIFRIGESLSLWHRPNEGMSPRCDIGLPGVPGMAEPSTLRAQSMEVLTMPGSYVGRSDDATLAPPMLAGLW